MLISRICCNVFVTFVLYRYCVLWGYLISNMLSFSNVYLTTCWSAGSAVMCQLPSCCTVIVCWGSLSSNMLRFSNVYLPTFWSKGSVCYLCITVIVCWKSYLFVWVSMSLSLTSVLYGYLCCPSFYVAWSHFRWGLSCFNSESLIP